MATVNFYIRKGKPEKERTEIQIRFCANRSYVKRALTGIFITVANWDYEKGMPKDKRSQRFVDEVDDVRERLVVLEQFILSNWEEAEANGEINDDSLNQWIDDVVWKQEETFVYVRGQKKACATWTIESRAYLKEAERTKKLERVKLENQPMLVVFRTFATEQFEDGKICKRRYDHYNSVIGVWERMERLNGKKYLIKEITSDDMGDFRRFIMNEHKFWEEKNGKLVPKSQYARLYKGFDITLGRGVKERSLNYINTEMKYVIAFWHWLIKVRECKVQDVFASFQRDNAVYGTPYYINSEDRTKLFNADLSVRPALAIQRDIFVFQSLIGCRVSDLLRLKKSNIVDGTFLQYVAGKTRNKSGKILNVPLHKDALTIIERYADMKGDMLLPFISSQKYNDAIREIFKAVPEVDRVVTVLNPVTRQEEQRYLHEVASSHMARRNFCGNLYEAGFSDSDIGSMSGHSEKSREIARYRKVSVERQIKMIDAL